MRRFRLTFLVSLTGVMLVSIAATAMSRTVSGSGQGEVVRASHRGAVRDAFGATLASADATLRVREAASTSLKSALSATAGLLLALAGLIVAVDAVAYRYAAIRWSEAHRGLLSSERVGWSQPRNWTWTPSDDGRTE